MHVHKIGDFEDCVQVTFVEGTVILLHNSRLVASVIMNLESGTSSWTGLNTQ